MSYGFIWYDKIVVYGKAKIVVLSIIYGGKNEK
jgi:hypothetical protein